MKCDDPRCTGYHKTARPAKYPVCPVTTERTNRNRWRYDRRYDASLKRQLADTAAHSRAAEAAAASLPIIRIGAPDAP